MENLSGKTIKGYELRERLGAGGFGAVYKAYQSTVGREVAVKIILPHFANHPDFIRRFETEAQLIARLEHLHIIPLYDFWRDPDGAYLVMRWLKGGSLREALQHGAFELEPAALLLDQIASALATAHRNNVIHRDLKPGNILLDEDGNAYLADFGIAKDVSLQGGITEVDAIVGSPDYLAPEQARSEPVTPHTDIYSLGVVLYEVLTGQHPFTNQSAVERLYKHLNDPLPDIDSLTDDVRDAVNAVIQKATAKNPAHRYADALELAAAFRQAARTQASGSLVETLTPREQEILQLIIEGHSNKEIAAQLFVTVMTVKWYVTQIYRKLGVRSRVQAIVRARELNLIVNGGAAGAPVIPTEDFRPENPYKGLRAFHAADHLDFFGREKLVQKLVRRMGEGGEVSRFLAVVGPSGSGKSSLVKAGLIPALWRGELPRSEKWFVIELLPGAHPLEELEVALTRVAANQVGNLHEHLRRDERGLLRAANLILPTDGSELVVVIDQFEEVFTMVEEEAERVHFLNLLHRAVTDSRSRVRVVVTLRADFYDRPLHYPEFGELVRSRMETILPLSAEELERAISKPAERVGVRFEEGLIASIVGEVNYQPGALPLLQYALTELFEQRKGRLLTHEAYQTIGRTVGALAKRADELYGELTAEGQEAARQMFLRLVTLGEGVEDTRRRAARSELLGIIPSLNPSPLHLPTPNPSPLRLPTPSPSPSQWGGETGEGNDLMDEVIDTFAAYRLLSLDNDPGTRTPTVEVAHEAILREWERLRAWLNESRDEIKLQRQLAAMAAEWREAHCEASFLARGSRLAQFEQWAEQTKLALTPYEREFLVASLRERERQEEAEEERQAREAALERRSVRFLRALAAVLLLATLGAFGLTGVAVNQSQIAKQNAAEAQNVALIAGSQAALANDATDQAIALALQAVTLDPTSARAQVALSAAAYAPGTIRTFVGHTGWVGSVALSSDGRTALSAGADGIVNLWDVQTGEIIRRFEGHTDPASSVAFMPDGQTAISGSEDRTLIQWDLQTGEILQRFEGHPDEVWSLAISPDGLYVASGGSESNIILWDLQTGDAIRHFEGHTAAIESVEFNADGSQLLTAGDTTVILWDVGTGQMLHRFEDNILTVYSATFSPDNRMILSSADSGTMILWDIETGQVIRRFYEEGGAAVLDVAFSPDARTILSGGVLGLAVWNIETAQPISRLRGHAGMVSSIVFSPDGRTALSSAADGALRLWDLQHGQIIRRFDSQGPVWTALAASPDGQRVLVGWLSNPGTDVILSDVNTGGEIRRYRTDEYVSAAAFSPDGQTALFGTDELFTASDLILWDVNSGEEIRRFTGHPDGIISVAFSPDGRTAASAGGGGTLILWNVATGQEIRRFEGYADRSWYYVEFSPDGQTLAATTHENSLIVLWDVATGAEIRQFEGHASRSLKFTFSGDGRQAFSGSEDNTMILWDVASGAILRRFRNCCPIPQVDMTSDGRLGIGGNNLWDLNTGEAIRYYDPAPFTFSFAPDNRTVLMGQFNDHIELWRIDATLDELLAWTRANRYIPDLTCDQRELYRLEPLCEVEADE